MEPSVPPATPRNTGERRRRSRAGIAWPFTLCRRPGPSGLGLTGRQDLTPKKPARLKVISGTMLDRLALTE